MKDLWNEIAELLTTYGIAHVLLAILVFAGIIAVAGIVFIMWWVLNLKLEPLEKLSKELSEAVKSLNEKIHDLTSKMWSPEALDNKIKVEVQDQIQEHIRNCPYKDKLNQ